MRIILFFILFTPVFSIYGQCSQDELIIEIVPDSYPGEISWELTSMGSVIASGNEIGDTICLDTSSCYVFTIYDSYGDGICCGYGNGYYNLFINSILVQTGGSYTFSESASFNCPPGSSCSDPLLVSEGMHSASVEPETWYEWSPDSLGVYEISTCLGDSCDTRIWVYDLCSGLVFDSGNTGTVFYNDDNPDCGVQAYLTGIFDPAQTYYIRVGLIDTSCSSSPVDWSLLYYSPIYGCTDPTACNYNPLATVTDTCYYAGDTSCPLGPDLWLLEDVLRNSMYVDTLYNTDACTVNEGCLRGFGDREIIRFTTHIKNIGEMDYYIGTPAANPAQFTWDNCHSHNHYAGYAEYVLYDTDNFATPIGFKNGFCVMDLECDDGGNQTYGCGNMGISYDCGDIYSHYLDCQWIDITDVDTGQYVFVARVNWDQAPDANGNYEITYDNNWAQACFHLDRDSISGITSIVLDTVCPAYLDCAGIPFGTSFVDCNGTCGGTALMGDLNGDVQQNTADASQYVDDIIGNNLTPSTCNDLNADGSISVYDAALVNSCYLFGSAHNHTGGGIHDHCNFPSGVKNIFDTTYLSIIGYDLTAGYIDIGIKNPTTKVVGYEFDMAGIGISSVDNLQPVSQYPVDPDFGLGGRKVIGLSYVDSLIDKSLIYTPLCRIHVFNITGSTICIDSIIDIVNQDYHTTTTVIEGPCIVVSSIEEFSKLVQMEAHPNPAFRNATVTLNSAIGVDGKIEIFDIVGKRIFDRKVKGSAHFKLQIDVANWNSGLYNVVYTSEEGKISLPLQVTKE